jgi:dTDP-4-amino-4,6-dideoxygalactose transaminase
VRVPITRPELPPLQAYEGLLAEIWQSRMLSNFGAFAQRMEAMTADYLGVPTRVVVSGDIGLVLTIAALDLTKGSTAVLPSFTFNSTVNAVLWNGIRPVFADIDRQTLNLDPQAVDEAAHQHGARLIVATHVFGNPANTGGLAEIADRHGARLIFDAAHGYGASRGGRKVGSFGDAEVFSLSGTKLVTSAEGGLVASSSEELLERISYLRGYGFRDDYNSKYVGLNGKMSELHAALGLLTLPHVDEAVAIRHRIAAAYKALLRGVPELAFQEVRSADTPTFKDFAILFSNRAQRDSVERALAAAEIQTKRYFLPAHHMDGYRAFSAGPLTNTEQTADRILCVPIFSSLQTSEVARIADVIATASRS